MKINDIVRIKENTRPWSPNGDIRDCGLGRIIQSNMSEDLSYHGSSEYQPIFKVRGDDGKIYDGFAHSWKGCPVNYGGTEVWFENI